jgi:hypothetical protein
MQPTVKWIEQPRKLTSSFKQTKTIEYFNCIQLVILTKMKF